MTYVDRTLNCVDCGVEFIHSAADQEYYTQKGFTSDPKRCASCRAYRRATRDGGSYDVRAIGGPRGYERTGFFEVDTQNRTDWTLQLKDPVNNDTAGPDTGDDAPLEGEPLEGDGVPLE